LMPTTVFQPFNPTDQLCRWEAETSSQDLWPKFSADDRGIRNHFTSCRIQPSNAFVDQRLHGATACATPGPFGVREFQNEQRIPTALAIHIGNLRRRRPRTEERRRLIAVERRQRNLINAALAFERLEKSLRPWVVFDLILARRCHKEGRRCAEGPDCKMQQRSGALVDPLEIVESGDQRSFAPKLFVRGDDPSLDPDCTDLVNPERGFFLSRDLRYLNESELRRSANTLVYAKGVLADHLDRDLDPDVLVQIKAGFSIVRRAGFKVLPRFYYVQEAGDPPGNTPRALNSTR